MKTCTKCGEVKELAGFAKRAAAADGLTHYCKTCISGINRKRREANLESDREANAAWRAANKEHLTRKMREWRLANLDRAKAHEKASREKWARLNPAARRAKDRRCQPVVARAATAWDADFDRLVEIEAYDVASLRTEATGVCWEVDHIVPLQSPKVCGLHNGHNLAVITRLQNKAKGNRFWPNMP